MRTVLLLLMLAGCSIEERGGQGTAPDTEIRLTGQEGDTVTVVIAAPGVARVGDDVPISIVVRNNRERHINLNLIGRDILFDIAVADADSTIVWQRLANTSQQQVAHRKTLAPGESFTLSDHWRATEPGRYIIGAELPTDVQPFQAQPVAIVVR